MSLVRGQIFSESETHCCCPSTPGTLILCDRLLLCLMLPSRRLHSLPPLPLSFPTGLFFLQVAFYDAGKSVFKRFVGLSSIPDRGFQRPLSICIILPTLIFIEGSMLKHNGALTIFDPLCISVASDCIVNIYLPWSPNRSTLRIRNSQSHWRSRSSHVAL